MKAGTERFGGIDVLVNNAGYGCRAAIEEGDDADVQRLFGTHVFGALSTIKAVLPQMRARRSAPIVNLSSIGARVTPAGSGYYSAVKLAIEGFDRRSSPRGQAARDHRDRRAAWIPDGFRRALADPIRHGHRRPHGDGGNTPQGDRHDPRHAA